MIQDAGDDQSDRYVDLNWPVAILHFTPAAFPALEQEEVLTGGPSGNMFGLGRLGSSWVSLFVDPDPVMLCCACLSDCLTATASQPHLKTAPPDSSP
jgi:hypothetical protein